MTPGMVQNVPFRTKSLWGLKTNSYFKHAQVDMTMILYIFNYLQNRVTETFVYTYYTSMICLYDLFIPV